MGNEGNLDYGNLKMNDNSLELIVFFVSVCGTRDSDNLFIRSLFYIISDFHATSSF